MEIFGGANPNLPTKNASLKPKLLIEKVFFTFQRRLVLMMYCIFAEKLDIYFKYANKPNFLVGGRGR